MHIKSIVAATTIALIAGVGSVSADENDVAGTAGDTGTLFAMLDGIAPEQLSIQELAATRGAGGEVEVPEWFLDVATDLSSASAPRKFQIISTGLDGAH